MRGARYCDRSHDPETSHNNMKAKWLNSIIVKKNYRLHHGDTFREKVKTAVFFCVIV